MKCKVSYTSSALILLDKQNSDEEDSYLYLCVLLRLKQSSRSNLRIETPSRDRDQHGFQHITGLFCVEIDVYLFIRQTNSCRALCD